jgi:hypothetical protein
MYALQCPRQVEAVGLPDRITQGGELDRFDGVKERQDFFERERHMLLRRSQGQRPEVALV